MSDPAAPIRVTTDGPVAIVTIDRPERRNAVDGHTAGALLEAFTAFAADDALSVAVLTGAGGTFCAGADLKAILEAGPRRGSGTHRLGPDEGPLGPTRMLIDKPLIAAVEGHAVAGGLELALWCDLRVAARDAVFGVYCRRWGVPLVDGGTVRLPRLIGHSHALDLILTGRGVSGDEALHMGLANRLTEPGGALDGALELAHELARLPQQCLREDRASSYEQWGVPLDAALRNEHEHGMKTLSSPDFLAGVARFGAGEGRHGASA
jgi:enoyl-CoA hydratase